MSLPSVDALPERSIVAARIVVALWLVGWTSKCVLLFEYFFKTLVTHPMVNDFFPAFFRSPLVAQVAYLLPLLALPVFVSRRQVWFCLAAIVLSVSSVLLLLHQDSANDATFETSFWVGVPFVRNRALPLACALVRTHAHIIYGGICDDRRARLGRSVRTGQGLPVRIC